MTLARTLVVVVLVAACTNVYARGWGGVGAALNGYMDGVRDAEGGSESRSPVGSFETATQSASPEHAGSGYQRCFYSTYGGFQFTINVRGSCPTFVRVNPATMQVITR